NALSIDCYPGGSVHQSLLCDAVSAARGPAGGVLTSALCPTPKYPAATFFRHKKEAIVSHDDADRAIQMGSLPVFAGPSYRSHLTLRVDLPDCAIASIRHTD